MTRDEYAVFVECVRRRCGLVTGCIVTRPAGGARNGADAAAAACGFSLLGRSWHEVEEPAARKLLEHLLRAGLAHGGRGMMSTDAARALVDQFFQVSDAPRKYFTNGDWGQWFQNRQRQQPSGSATFAPITASILDAGLICVGGTTVAMLWFESKG